MTDELDRFGQQLMTLVRDEAVADLDALAARRMGGPEGTRWRELLADARTQQVVQELLPDIVDLVLARFLHTLDTGSLPLAVRRPDGSYADLADLGRGELAGGLYDDEGWRVRFSRTRYNP